MPTLKLVRIDNALNIFFRQAKAETIALYGKAYIPAAKDTWKLFKDRGIDALVNDSLVSMSKHFMSDIELRMTVYPIPILQP